MSYYRPKTTDATSAAQQAAYYNQYYAPQYSAVPTVDASNPYAYSTYAYPTYTATAQTAQTAQSAYYAQATSTVRPTIVRPTIATPPVIASDSTVKARPSIISSASVTYPVRPTASYTATEATKTSTESTTVRPVSKVGPTDPKKKLKKKTVLRSAGGQTWEDDSLLTWDPNDFRIFCGDLGNEVTDDLLGKAFSKYKSFLKAHVVRDKRSQKTKGYGFVSFKDPNDFVKAMKEMNGKYIGNRPVKLRKSTWKDRNMDSRKRKPY